MANPTIHTFYVIDMPVEKRVEARYRVTASENKRIPKGIRNMTLWSGAGYDAIGQWTDAQAQARIQELLAQQYPNT